MGLTGFYWVLIGFPGFYRILPSFTGFYWDLPSFYWVFTLFYRVWLGFAGFRWDWLGSNGFYWVLPCCFRVLLWFAMFLLGFIWFYRVWLGLTGFYRFFFYRIWKVTPLKWKLLMLEMGAGCGVEWPAALSAPGRRRLSPAPYSERRRQRPGPLDFASPDWPTGRAMTTPSSDLVPTGFRIFDLTCDVIKSVFYGIFAVLQGHLRLWLVHRITWHRIQWPLVCYRVLPSFWLRPKLPVDSTGTFHRLKSANQIGFRVWCRTWDRFFTAFVFIATRFGCLMVFEVKK